MNIKQNCEYIYEFISALNYSLLIVPFNHAIQITFLLANWPSLYKNKRIFILLRLGTFDLNFNLIICLFVSRAVNLII